MSLVFAMYIIQRMEECLGPYPEGRPAAASWLLECATDGHEDCDREKSSCASTDHTGHEGEDVNAEEIWPQPLGATISDFVVASEQRRLLTALTEQNE